MTAKPITIQHLSFQTRDAARAHFTEMLKRYPLRGTVSGQDHDDLRALLDLHSEASAKIGPGVDHFEVDFDGFKYRCFYVVRTDMTRIDFSINNCLTGKKR